MSAVLSLDLFRVHGGKVDAARASFPQAREPWIDLSTGISPWAYPHDAIPREAFTRLPDPEAIAALEAAAAASFGVPNAEHVIATPGSDLALRVMGRVFSGKRVAVVRPGYSGHILSWTHPDVTTISTNDLESAAGSHDVLVLANPNNPDGRLIARERLLAVARRLAEHGGALVVDEAFADVAPEQSVCGTQTCVVVFRSFGKFYGLAGLRLGFVVAPDADQRRAFRHAVGDWPVAGPAVAVGTAAYLDLQWQAMQRERLVVSAQRLDALLQRAGLTVMGGTALFRLARCGPAPADVAAGERRVARDVSGADPVGAAIARPADVLFEHLASHGILTRPFSSDPSLMRFGLPGDETQWQRLALALTSRCMQ